MTRSIAKILMKAKAIIFHWESIKGYSNYVLLEFEDPNEAIDEYRNIFDSFSNYNWYLKVDNISDSIINIALTNNSSTEPIKISGLKFDKNEFELFVKNVPSDSSIGFFVGKDNIVMNRAPDIQAFLKGYTVINY